VLTSHSFGPEEGFTALGHFLCARGYDRLDEIRDRLAVPAMRAGFDGGQSASKFPVGARNDSSFLRLGKSSHRRAWIGYRGNPRHSILILSQGRSLRVRERLGHCAWPAALRQGVDYLERQHKSMPDYVFAFFMAKLYAELGDKDRAFESLELAYKKHDVWLIGLRSDFALNSLRSDPRYAELVRRIGFPK
jgi:hypothetical protein